MSAFSPQADLLAVLVASSATFQAIVSAGTVAEARASVAIPVAFDEEQGDDQPLAYPRAIITDGGVINRKAVGVGARSGTGSLFLAFEVTIPQESQGTVYARRAYFMAKVSAIIQEMEAVSDSRATPSGYTTSHLQIKEINRVNGPGEIPIDEREQPADDENPLDPLWVIEFEVTY